jgi:hypothetical protein
MLIPSLLYFERMSLNDRTNQIQFASVETTIVRELDGLKPELARHPFATDVNVPCLAAIEAVEVEPVRAWDALYGRHANRVHQHGRWIRLK